MISSPRFPFLLKVSLDVDIGTGKPTLANESTKLTISRVLPLWSESVFHILLASNLNAHTSVCAVRLGDKNTCIGRRRSSLICEMGK